MKFVFFGYDFMIGAIQRLINDGHEPVSIFTFPCDNVFNFNQQTIALAQKHNISLIETKPTVQNITDCLANGADLFLCAGYPFKIPDIPEDKAYAINIHPSHLPQGRGIMPTPFILMDHPQAAGFTIHKLTSKIDAGDILYQERFRITAQETVETYSARIAIRVQDKLPEIIKNLIGLWENATPQNEAEASHFPMPTDRMRLLDWSLPAKRLADIGRAFGSFGALAQIENEIHVVTDFDVWEENHTHLPGHIVLKLSRETIIAAKDGFVCLKKFNLIEN